MTQFRIYTEELQHDEIAKIVAEHFDSFTLFYGNGYWKSLSELSLCIEILAEDTFMARQKVGKIAQAIKTLNKQEAVLVTEHEVKETFV